MRNGRKRGTLKYRGGRAQYKKCKKKCIFKDSDSVVPLFQTHQLNESIETTKEIYRISGKK